jgi:RecA/RadA recombinase
MSSKNIREAIMGKKAEEKVPVYFNTGSTLLDLVVGGGEAIGYGMGYPAGTIVRDWGGSSATKTFKAVELIATNYYKFKDKFRWKYQDVECGNTIDTQSLYGFDIFQHEDKRPVLTVEDWEYDVHKFLDSIEPDERGIYVLDSLDSLSSAAIQERKEERHAAYDKGKEYDQGTYGMDSAKFMSQEMFRGLARKLEEKNSLLYVISQERDNANAGMYGKKNRLGGGRAIGFYETVRIYSKMKEKEDRKGRVVSVTIELTAEKTRHPRPFRKCLVPIIFDYGIDNKASELDYLFDLRSAETGELLKRAKNVIWDDKEMDRDALIAYIEKNNLEKELTRRCIEKWEAEESEAHISRAKKF